MWWVKDSFSISKIQTNTNNTLVTLKGILKETGYICAWLYKQWIIWCMCLLIFIYTLMFVFFRQWYIYIWIYTHHHHHVMPLARISLTLSRHFSLSFIASGRSSGLHPIPSHSCCMYVLGWSSCFCSAICGSQ